MQQILWESARSHCDTYKSASSAAPSTTPGTLFKKKRKSDTALALWINPNGMTKTEGVVVGEVTPKQAVSGSHSTNIAAILLMVYGTQHNELTHTQT